MKAPGQRRLSGSPIPREVLIAQWEDLRPATLFEVRSRACFSTCTTRSRRRPTNGASNWTAVACDALTRHHTDDRPADKVERLGELADRYL